MEHLVPHQDFAGASALLAVNSPMNKRGLLPVVVFLGLFFSLAAQEASASPPGHGGTFTLAQLRRMTAPNNGSVLLPPSLFNSLDNPVFGFPFSNRDVFSLSTTFDLMGTMRSFLPLSRALAPPRVTLPPRSAKDSSNRLFDLRPNFDYVTGEVGSLYGHSSGQVGADELEGS